jgi:hypothetical protein
MGDAEPRAAGRNLRAARLGVHPVKFDAREWVALAKRAGMRDITITARHHDGFSMVIVGTFTEHPEKGTLTTSS